MQVMADQSGAIQISGENAWTPTGGLMAITIKQAGYISVFTSTRSPRSVYWDQIRLVQYKGTVLEENHYYPFGLTLTTAYGQNGQKNSEKFQSQHLEDDFGLNWYNYKYRMHDPQIGRFVQVDPLAERYTYNSTYAFSENKVVNGVELEGLEFYYSSDGRLLGRGDDPENLQARLAASVNTLPDGRNVFVSISPTWVVISNNNDDLLRMSATIYGETTGDPKEAMAIGSTMVNYANATNQTVSQEISDNSYAIAVGGNEFNNFYSSSDRNSDSKALVSIAGAINALTGGIDYSNHALFWDHRDILTNANHEKRTMGLLVNGLNVNIAGFTDGFTSTKLDHPHTSVLGIGINGDYLRSTSATNLRATGIGLTYTYETTAGVGGAVFTKLTQAATDAGLKP